MEFDLASVKNKSMLYRTKAHSWISLIHSIAPWEDSQIPSNIQAPVFENMHHNAKTFHSGVEF